MSDMMHGSFPEPKDVQGNSINSSYVHNSGFGDYNSNPDMSDVSAPESTDEYEQTKKSRKDQSSPNFKLRRNYDKVNDGY